MHLSNLFTSTILSSDVSCRPVSVVLALPWPNVTEVQQMTPTHVTVQRWEQPARQPTFAKFHNHEQGPLVESTMYSAYIFKNLSSLNTL